MDSFQSPQAVSSIGASDSAARFRLRQPLRVGGTSCGARQNGGVVHLWLHPHNLITGPGTAALLENVLAEAGSLRDRGEIRVLTQRDYCREQLALGNVAEAA